MKLKLFAYCLAVVFSLGFVSCNKSVEDLLGATTTTDTSSISTTNAKVVYIVVDGMRGAAISDVSPTNLLSMLRRSIATYYGLANSSGLNTVGWADMLTGVDSAEHLVKTNSFAGNNFAAYPSIVTRIKTAHPDWRTAAFARSSLLSSSLLSDATDSKVFSSDVDVKNSLVNELSENDASFVFGEFSSVDSAGAADGYGSDVDSYKNAIIKVDSYIGEVLDALKSRSNYKSEDWLVVVASNKGGYLSSYTPESAFTADRDYNNPESNSFIFFYNPKFVLSYYAKPDSVAFSGSAPYFSTNAHNANTPSATTTDYDVTSNNEMTVSFKIKPTSFGGYNSGIIEKSASAANSNTGWWIIHSNSDVNPGRLRFVLKGSSTFTLNSTQLLSLNTWNTVTAKVYNKNSARWIKLFINGVSTDSMAASSGSCATSTPLYIGYYNNYGSAGAEYLKDIRIYNANVTDADIAAMSCKPYIDSVAELYSDNLIGYWPCDDATGNTIKDYSSKGNDFVVNSFAGWSSYSDISNNLCPKPSDSYFVQNPRPLDIPYEIATWLGIFSTTWGLDGKYWYTTYNTISY